MIRAMIRKALIPMAGFGTRMGPLARVVPKAMFPLVSADGQVRPVIHWIVSEALAAGVEQVGLTVNPAHVELVRRYFAAADEAAGSDLAQRLEYVIIPRPEGLGAAVAYGETFLGDEPFLLLLGDYVYVQATGRPTCAAQVASAFAEWGGAAMIGMQPVGPDEVPRCGVARGEPLGGGVYRCTRLIEKPDLDTARRELVTPGLAPHQFLAHAGIYAFSPEIFHCVDELMSADRPDGEEVELTDAQVMLLERHPDECRLLRIAGRGHDTGNPAAYLAAQAAVRHARTTR